MQNTILDQEGEASALSEPAKANTRIVYVFLYSGILFVAFAVNWFAQKYSPEHIRVNPYFLPLCAVVIFKAMIIIFIIAQRNFLKLFPRSSILNLMFLCALIGFITACCFTLMLQPFFEMTVYERIINMLERVATMAVITTIVSFFIAFQLKTKKTAWLIIMLIALLLLLSSIGMYFSKQL